MGDETPHWSERDKEKLQWGFSPANDGSLRWAPDPAHAFATDAAALEAPVPAGPWATDNPAPIAEAVPIPIAQLWPLRIAIGLGQGLLFFALFHTRTLNVWPGADVHLLGALALAGLFVPLVLLEGVGTIAPRRLLPFAGIATGMLALLGWYQQWRSVGDAALPGFVTLMLCALALAIVQAALLGRERGHQWRMAYAELFVATWILGARLAMWGWTSLLGFLLLQAIGLAPQDGQPIALLLLSLVSALGFQLSAALPRFTSVLADMLAATATALLPMAAGVALLIVSLSLARGPAPLLLLFLAMTALLVTINASHRGDEDRRPWRDGAEIFGAGLLLVLAGMALWVLEARVAAHGWTGPRILAVTIALLFTAYGAGYGAAALSFLLRGHGLARVQRVNRLMAAMVLLACIALVSPAADPHRIAAAAQAARLEDGRTTPERFDFAHLEQDGTRFGREALASLALSLYPDIARAARSVHGPIVDPRAPDEIGPNIALVTSGATPDAHLPATFLARDWSPVLGAPACMTRASARCEAHMLDLNQDRRDEILLVSGDASRWWAAVLEADEAGRWSMAGRLTSGCGVTRSNLVADLAAGRIASLAALPGWTGLSLAGTRLSAQGAPCTE
jgi:hypothetical protein